MPLVLLVLLPWLGSLFAVMLPSNARNAESTAAGLISLTALVQAALYFPAITRGDIIEQRISWLPSLGLDLVLRMDGLAWLFTMLVLGIGALVVLYARYYMSPADPVPRFFAFLMSFMGAMTGVVLSGNLVMLVVFWELTSIYSFLLIGYWHHRDDARRGARMALLVTGAGGLALFAGVLLIGHVVGSYQLADVLASGDAIRRHAFYQPILACILLGALTKSAQFPFLFWLPRAMAAPTPVSAYLHSATMVKLGVFLLARLWPVLSGTEEWFLWVSGAGAASLLVGAFLAMFQTDLKGLLAYSSISHLGLITLLLGMNRRGGGRVSHHQPRHLQGVALHGGGHRRSRDRYPRHPQALGADPEDAGDRGAGPGGQCRHGGRAAAQRVPLEGDVLCRHTEPGDFAAHRRDPAGGGHGGRHVQRDLCAALCGGCVLWPPGHRPAA